MAPPPLEPLLPPGSPAPSSSASPAGPGVNRHAPAALELSLSFDDVLLLPGYSQVLPTECDVATQLGSLTLRMPLLSAAMDTVTESQTAIAMALSGGLGVLHKNCDPEEQAKMVRRVKKFQHAVIASPVTVKPTQTVGEVQQLITSNDTATTEAALRSIARGLRDTWSARLLALTAALDAFHARALGSAARPRDADATLADLRAQVEALEHVQRDLK